MYEKNVFFYWNIIIIPKCSSWLGFASTSKMGWEKSDFFTCPTPLSKMSFWNFYFTLTPPPCWEHFPIYTLWLIIKGSLSDMFDNVLFYAYLVKANWWELKRYELFTSIGFDLLNWIVCNCMISLTNQNYYWYEIAEANSEIAFQLNTFKILPNSLCMILYW